MRKYRKVLAPLVGKYHISQSFYLPMQKREKMLERTSSGVKWPVMEPREVVADRRSWAMRSVGVWECRPSKTRERARAVSQRAS